MTKMVQTEREYAEALFIIAEEKNLRGEYLAALKTVRQLFNENPEYEELLASPAIPLSERCGVLDEAFGSMPEDVVSFLKILCESSHIRTVCDCVGEFEKLAMEAEKCISATVISAIELSEEQKKALCAKLQKISGKSVSAVYTVDKTLIGGLKIEFDGKTFDGSLKQHLSDVKEVIIG